MPFEVDLALALMSLFPCSCSTGSERWFALTPAERSSVVASSETGIAFPADCWSAEADSTATIWPGSSSAHTVAAESDYDFAL